MENPAEIVERECPVCLGRMQIEERADSKWLVCPNGCPTEMEAPAPIPETLGHKVAAA